MLCCRPFSIAISLAVVSIPLSAQWTVGVGGDPLRSSLSPQVGPTEANVLWQGSLPAIVSQQAVIDGDLVVVNRITSFTIPTGTSIVGHDLNTGAIRWQMQLPMNFADSWRSRVTGVRDGQVYATRAGNTNAEFLYALSPIDGSILWESVDLITETTTESVTFAPDGDVITTGEDASGSSVLHRIERVDGTTVWSVPRTCPTSGGCDAVVYAPNDRVYMWEASSNGPKITAVELSTGTKLYDSGGLAGGFVQQVAPFVGADGTVYAPRTANNPATDFLFALEDTGNALVQKWDRPIGYVPFASHAVGPDGSVYAYAPDLKVMRLDPVTGATLDESAAPIGPDFPAQPRMAVDASGKLLLTNGGFGNGELQVYTPDLRLIWSVPINGVNVGGPALGQDGTLVVCGTGTNVVAYRTDCDGYFVEYGAGCPGTGSFQPQLSGSGCPTGGASITLAVNDGLGGALAFFGIGLGTGVSTVQPGCDLQIGPLLGPALPFVLPGGGAGNGDLGIAFFIPPAVSSLDLFAQVFVIDAAGSGGVSASNPLQVHVE